MKSNQELNQQAIENVQAIREFAQDICQNYYGCEDVADEELYPSGNFTTVDGDNIDTDAIFEAAVEYCLQELVTEEYGNNILLALGRMLTS